MVRLKSTNTRYRKILDGFKHNPLPIDDTQLNDILKAIDTMSMNQKERILNKLYNDRPIKLLKVKNQNEEWLEGSALSDLTENDLHYLFDKHEKIKEYTG